MNVFNTVLCKLLQQYFIGAVFVKWYFVLQQKGTSLTCCCSVF